jgi:hypothetical protein
LNPHTFRYRNLNPEGAQRGVANGRQRRGFRAVGYHACRFGPAGDDSGTIAWWPRPSVELSSRHVCRHPSHQADRAEGPGQVGKHARARRFRSAGTERPTVTARRGLRSPRGSASFVASTRHFWTSSLDVARQDRRTEPLETLHGAVETFAEIEELLSDGEIRGRRWVSTERKAPSTAEPSPPIMTSWTCTG